MREEYRAAVETRIKPKVQAFQPEFILVAMGFDAHVDDLMADILLTAEGFDFLSRTVVDLAECCTGGRVISVLEGGYNPQTLPGLVEKHLRILAGLER
jgi:acetoin utilization deacetylase AcuC-like enzyme